MNNSIYLYKSKITGKKYGLVKADMKNIDTKDMHYYKVIFEITGNGLESYASKWEFITAFFDDEDKRELIEINLGESIDKMNS